MKDFDRMKTGSDMSGKITILLPCRDQKEGFFVDAVNSVLQQTSPDWALFIIIEPDTPYKLRKIINAYLSDKRLQMITSERPTIAGALNTGMKYADTEFVCILLSDDKLDKRSVQVLRHYIKKYPETDFFHSSRRFIDAKGYSKGRIMRSKETFDLDYFKKYGSPVKHLLCWRRKKGLSAGGMDEDAALHGCDDYDFPWLMAEAGCNFKAIKECLYYYRVHHDFYRLTTHVSLREQIEIIKKIFKKHKVSELETNKYIDMAIKGHLIKDKLLNF